MFKWPAPWGGRGGGGHLARKCDTKRQCFKCSCRHHLAVCNSSMRDSSDNSARAAASPVLHIGSGVHVFLQTAQANISIPIEEGILSHILSVRSIFDTGGRRSYINQKVVNVLKLKTVRTEREIENCNIWGSEPRAGSCQPGRTFF